MRAKFGLVLILVVGLLMMGCSSEEAAQPEAVEPAAEVTAELVTLTEAIAEGPIVLTSAGQSADVKMIESLIKKTDMEYTIDTVLAADSLGESKTLVLAIGGSSKGLGAAGINAEDEIARIADVIAKAEENNMTIIGMHVGGEGRRGELSDKFIDATVPSVDYFVYVESGNQDSLLSDLASGNGIPSESVESIAASFEALQKAFK